MDRSHTMVNDISVVVDIRYLAGLEAFVKTYCENSERGGDRLMYKVGCELIGRKGIKGLERRSLYLDPD